MIFMPNSQCPIPNSQLSTVESIAGETIVEIAVYLPKILSSVRIVIALCSTTALSVFGGRQQDLLSNSRPALKSFFLPRISIT